MEAKEEEEDEEITTTDPKRENIDINKRNE